MRRTLRTPLTLSVVVALILAACSDDADDESAMTTTAESTTTFAQATTTTLPPLTGLIERPVRHPATERPVYFVMTDRFANGFEGNDTGGLDPAAGPQVHGFLPTDTGFYHGGDLVGLTDRLDYIVGLGMEAIWITPPFVNRAVQGDGTVEGSSAGYHGYWNIDWTRIDPHLGSTNDMISFIEAANERGIDVYFDVVMNHTGDVITFEENTFAYRGTGSAPYLTAEGTGFDPAELADSPEFPELAADVSFPYTPTFATESDATIKAPEWLNDVTVYHNRGNSTFQGESSLLGDFFGLDDLFTEDPRVVQGMIDLYTDVIETYPIAGFRIDTAKHVNDGFWAEFMPAIRRAAADAGRPDFFMFGEVFSEDPIFNSFYSTTLGFSSTLDFGFDAAVRRFALNGAGSEQLAGYFDDDDWYTDADSNASMQVKFLGNHDEGRLGYFTQVALRGAGDADQLAAMQLSLDIMFTTRGIPLVYYGDEQGFTGSGGDQGARQPMFAAQTPEYLDDDLIGTDRTHAEDNYEIDHPLYAYIAGLSELRRIHPTLESGAQITRFAGGETFAFSRIDRNIGIEYMVVANAGDEPEAVTVPTATSDGVFSSVYGEAMEITAGPDAGLTLEVPGNSVVVLMADRRISTPAGAVDIRIVRPGPDVEIPTLRYRVEAELSDDRYGEVTFSVAVDGGEPVLLGVDDAAPYRVYWDNAGYADGASVEFFAVVDDLTNPPVETSVTSTLGAR
jgi:glycosidase